MKNLSVVALLFASLLFAGCPEPKPTPTPTPTPTPPPGECACVVPGSEDPGWKGATVEEVGMERYYVDVFAAGRLAIGDVCGKPVDQSREAMVAFFRSQNVCAGPFGSENMIAARPDGLWEELHPISGASGDCWATKEGAYKGLWKNTTSTKVCK